MGFHPSQSWQLNLLGIYDYSSECHPVGLEPYFRFLRASSGELHGDVVEFGVFRGRSLLAAALLMRELGDPRIVVGFDTFKGFPDTSIEDESLQFDDLLRGGRITPSHHAAIQENAHLLSFLGRDLSPTNSSSSGAFSDTSRFEVERKIAFLGLEDRIKLVEGNFADTIREEACRHRSISVALIDSDLFESYRTVLPFVWERLEVGGMAYLDEYFSLKFPGPRRAVDNFCEEIGVLPTLLEVSGGFERWCLMKP